MSVVAAKDEKFNECFRELVYERMTAADEVLNDPEYKEADEQADQVEEEIRQLLGQEEGFRLIDKYCNSYGRKLVLTERSAYKNGMADGIRFCLEIGLAR